MTLEFRDVQSSSMRRVGYDAESKTLEITFNSLRTYRYDNVPKEIADGLLNAKSKGSYFAENIVNVYTYRCLNPPPPKEPKNAAETKPSESKSVQRRKAAQKKIQPI